jgi:Arm DNA-binding domain
MAQRKENRLVPVSVDRLKLPGMYPDGHGLYLRAGPNGAKSWIFRYKINKRRHEMGLGGFPLVSLAEARDLAKGHRKQIHDGFNPLEQRRAQSQAAKLEAANRMTKPISLKPSKHGKIRNTPHNGLPLLRLMRTPFSAAFLCNR